MSVPTPIDVVFAIDDNYATATTIVAHSIKANLREQATPLRLHVIDGGLGTEGRAEVRAGLGVVGEVVIHSVEGHFQLPQAKIKHWTSAALGRLHVGTVLPDDLHRVIYLDADTVVLGDLSELIEEDLGGQAIGAVLNEVGGDRSWQLKDTAVYSDHGAPAPGYFNSGVLLLDMDRWRAEGVTERIDELYGRYGAQLRTHDQDVLNIVFAGAWHEIPEKWNKLVEHSRHGRFGNGRLDYLTEPDGIVHFIGDVKPWHDEFPGNALKNLYASYARAA